MPNGSSATPYPPLLRRLYGEVANGGGYSSNAGLLVDYIAWRDMEEPEVSGLDTRGRLVLRLRLLNVGVARLPRTSGKGDVLGPEHPAPTGPDLGSVVRVVAGWRIGHAQARGRLTSHVAYHSSTHCGRK